MQKGPVKQLNSFAFHHQTIQNYLYLTTIRRVAVTFAPDKPTTAHSIYIWDISHDGPSTKQSQWDKLKTRREIEITVQNEKSSLGVTCREKKEHNAEGNPDLRLCKRSVKPWSHYILCALRSILRVAVKRLCSWECVLWFTPTDKSRRCCSLWTTGQKWAVSLCRPLVR